MNTPIRHVRLKRAYDPPEPSDGTRILVDRLWRRGIKKTDAAIDRWLRDLAPSTELRRRFGHGPERWPEFHRRYRAELRRHPELVEEIRKAAQAGPVTLVYAARDEAHNDAAVLKELLTGRRRGTRSRRIGGAGLLIRAVKLCFQVAVCAPTAHGVAIFGLDSALAPIHSRCLAAFLG